MTTFTNDPWMVDYDEPCHCGNGKIHYFCNIETCEDNKEQKIYCTDCVLSNFKHFTAHLQQKVRYTIKDEG